MLCGIRKNKTESTSASLATNGYERAEIMPARERNKKGRFSRDSLDHRKTRIENLKRRKPVVSDHFDISSTLPAGRNILLPDDHSYASFSSFDYVNQTFFAGRMRHLSNLRFIVDLETFFSNMKCDVCFSSSISPLYILKMQSVLFKLDLLGI